MPRLFLAIDLSTELKSALADLQQELPAGSRLTSPEQMHLTLHFLGEAEVAAVVEAVREVSVPSFHWQPQGVGTFSGAGRMQIVWAGIEPCNDLITLHRELAVALVRAGFPVESRPYHPHLTLARCGPRITKNQVREFVQTQHAWQGPEQFTTQFRLYSSELTRSGPRYRCEAEFPLPA